MRRARPHRAAGSRDAGLRLDHARTGRACRQAVDVDADEGDVRRRDARDPRRGARACAAGRARASRALRATARGSTRSRDRQAERRLRRGRRGRSPAADAARSRPSSARSRRARRSPGPCPAGKRSRTSRDRDVGAAQRVGKRRSRKKVVLPTTIAPSRSVSACRRPRSSASRRSTNRSHAASSTRPSSRPTGVSRRSALSWRSITRCSARDVSMRYGSSTPRVTRSSISTPMYDVSRPSRSGASPCARRAALMPAISPCAAASS